MVRREGWEVPKHSTLNTQFATPLMRISAEWLGEYVALPALDKLEETLLMAGLGIEAREGDRFELEITSNRGDWLCATGIAREIGAMTETRFRAPVPDADEDGAPLGERVGVEIENALDCPRYAARLVEGLTVGPSPEWMQKRLLDCGVRPINNVVDVTNYVMLEWGQPMHAFDFDTLESGKIEVRRAREGEMLTTLDGVERVLTPEILVIANGEDAVAIAGVMGGANSEVSENTTSVLLESAHFSPQRVRRNAHLLGVSSEASKRFERFVDPSGCTRALDRAAQLLSQIAGGKTAIGTVDRYLAPIHENVVNLRPARANAILGLKIPVEWMKEALVRLGFRVWDMEGGLRAQSPSWRRDIEREIDLIEEIARLWGYGRVPTTLHGGVNTAAGRPLAARLEDRARSACLRCGLTELISISLSNDEAHQGAGVSTQNAVRLRNALTEDFTLLRTSLIPSLLESLQRNRGRQLCGFELGRVYISRGPSELCEEKRVLGLALADAPPLPHWQKDAVAIDFFALKAIVTNLLLEFGAPTPVYVAAQTPTFHPGRCASVLVGGEELGVLGEIHPTIAAQNELSGRVYVASLDFEALVRHLSLVRSFKPFPRFPSVERDLALVVPATVPASVLLDATRRAGGELLEWARVFDVYQGTNIPDGSKSLALALRLRAADRTLGESDVETVLGRILEAARALGAVLRA